MAVQIHSAGGDNQQRPLQLFVKLLDGKTLSLQFHDLVVEARSVKQRISELTMIPVQFQRLICGNQLKDDSVILQSDSTLNLSLRLPGGKGGFGSLLRGAATKAGQKKTSNFEACRDMSGRRLRHVNAERRLEEWKEEEEGRKLEKMAADFIKKKTKTGKKGVGDGETSMYVEKYREESAKCVAVVEESVKEAFKNRKRKVLSDGADAKRLMIWMGKRKSDADMNGVSSEDEDDEEIGKSVILNNGNYSDSSKGSDVSPGTATGGLRELSGGASCESGCEEEKEIFELQGLESGEEAVLDVDKSIGESDLYEEKAAKSSGRSHIELVVVTRPEAGLGVGKSLPSSAEVCSSQQSGVDEETVAAAANIAEPDKPLNFVEFNSPEEMEALGMEKLKSELQAHGLKCGGTLHERAARLFLLKSTPLDKLPKKLLVKK